MLCTTFYCIHRNNNVLLLSNGHSPQIRENGELLVRMCRMRVTFFQKWPLANVGESGESVTAFWRIWRILKLGRFMYKKKIFLGIKRSSLSSPDSPNSLNLLNLLNTRQIRRSESQKFAQYSPNSPEQVTKIWQIFGEYSNSLNLPASGHCLVIILFCENVTYKNSITKYLSLIL